MNIITRSSKGSPLTFEEMDNNWVELISQLNKKEKIQPPMQVELSNSTPLIIEDNKRFIIITPIGFISSGSVELPIVQDGEVITFISTSFNPSTFYYTTKEGIIAPDSMNIHVSQPVTLRYIELTKRWYQI